jgi:uncharacterized protein
MFTLSLLATTLAVCRLDAQAPLPAWLQGEFIAVVRTANELSAVCDAAVVPGDVLAERGWRVLCVQGPLDFSLVGVLAALSKVLADAGVSIFAISTYDTDYLLIKDASLEAAILALRQAGHVVQALAA